MKLNKVFVVLFLWESVPIRKSENVLDVIDWKGSKYNETKYKVWVAYPLKHFHTILNSNHRTIVDTLDFMYGLTQRFQKDTHKLQNHTTVTTTNQHFFKSYLSQ